MAESHARLFKRKPSIATGLSQREIILKGGDGVATGVQITLIICATLIMLSVISVIDRSRNK